MRWIPRLVLVAVTALTTAGALRGAAPAPNPLSDAQTTTDLRRAKSRLERGDIFLAAPLFEKLAVRFTAARPGEHGARKENGQAVENGKAVGGDERNEGVDGPTVMLIAEGLARCRLSRGDAPAAVGPWLASLGARLSGLNDEPFPSLPLLVDPATGLAPALAPIWLAGPELAALIDDNFRDEFLADSTSTVRPSIPRELASWYRRSALFELGLADDLPPVAPSASEQPEDAGVQLVVMIVSARIGADQVRADARAAIETALSAELATGGGTWREAWLRAALGRSLLREPDIAQRDRGLLELMHLPARFAQSLPRLAALALAEASREYDQRHDTATAQKLAALLTGPLADPAAIRWLQSARKPALSQRPGASNIPGHTPIPKDQPNP